MSSSLPGSRELPASQYDLSTYWGRVRQSTELTDPRTLFVSSAGLDNAKKLITAYKTGEIKSMTAEVWKAKKIVDSTLHPDTGQPVLLPFRMSCFVISNLVVTAGMLSPNLGTTGTILWQMANQSLNVGINSANANKSTPLTTSQLTRSYLLAVSASCGVAVGLNSLVPRLSRLRPTTRTLLSRLVPFVAVASAGVLNVFLMRGEEIRVGIDVYPLQSSTSSTSSSSSSSYSLSPSQAQPLQPQVTEQQQQQHQQHEPPPSLGKSRTAAIQAISQTAISRILNATPIMVLPPLILFKLQQKHQQQRRQRQQHQQRNPSRWHHLLLLKQKPSLLLPLNLVLILLTSIVALPLALAVFPQRQVVPVASLEREFWGKVGLGKEGVGEGEGEGEGGAGAGAGGERQGEEGSIGAGRGGDRGGSVGGLVEFNRGI